jgi:hypothetical protein
MALHYPNLDGDTRLAMLSELQSDIPDRIYWSPRLSGAGRNRYIDLLRGALAAETDGWLAGELARFGSLLTHEIAHRGGKAYEKAVPYNANETLAEGEFNRYYIRAICVRALDEQLDVQVVRAKAVANPRPVSEMLIGTRPDPAGLLQALRTDHRVDNAFGLPPGPNSGLTLGLLVRVS